MKNPRKLLWLLLPAALGIVSVSIGFSAYQMNHIEKNDGTVTESLYSVTFHWDMITTTDGTTTTTNQKVTYEGLEYTSGLDLKVLPDEWGSGTFSGWKIGSADKETGSTTFTNDIDHSVKDLWSAYIDKPSDNAIHLWAVWTAA